MAVTVFKPEEQNASQAPTLGMGSGTFGANAQQRKNIAQGGSGRFTNLQQYVQANEANNPNAQLLQREGQTRQGELGTRQQEFVKQAEPIKSGFQAIRSGQEFVQSALDNPTQIVQDPSNIQRFAGYRTGGIGDIETPFNQLQSARGTLGTQQEQLASGLETIQRDPNALQNYLQSQRANPSLATRGENVLDRFLTQSTESGQRAIAGLGTTAGAIRSTQAPSIIGDIEALRTQAQGKPLSSADVGNLLTRKITPEEEFVRSINNLYIAQNVGLGGNLGEDKIQYSNNVLQTPLMDYVKPQNLGIATQSSIDEAKAQYDKFNQFTNQNKLLEQALADNQNELTKAENNFSRDPYDITAGARNAEVTNQLRNNIRNLQKQKNDLISQSSGMDVSKVPVYQQYLNQLGKTKQELLSQYDPTRLSRIQALQQLSGSTPFTPLLQQRLS
jgi:hypothetical protein